MRVRPGTIDDAEALACLHVEVWRETYRDLAPAKAPETLDEARRLPYWQTCLASADPLTGALVAEQEAALLGVVSFGPTTHPEMEGAIEDKLRVAFRSSPAGALSSKKRVKVIQPVGIHASGKTKPMRARTAIVPIRSEASSVLNCPGVTSLPLASGSDGDRGGRIRSLFGLQTD